jgi:hypothetical protein
MDAAYGTALDCARFAAVATLLPLAGWLAVRRGLATPTPPPVPPGIVAIGGLAVVALLLLIRVSQRKSRVAAVPATRTPLWQAATIYGPNLLLSLTALLFAFALTVPGQPTWSILGLWTLFTATESWAWRSHFMEAIDIAPRTPSIRDLELDSLEPASLEPDSLEQALPEQSQTESPNSDRFIGDVAISTDPVDATEDWGTDAEEEEFAECDETEALPAGVGQQWTRGGSAVDGEWIEVLTRVALEPGQRHAVVHLAFCPAFLATPKVQAHVVHGVPADVSIAEQRVYGARLELRISQPSTLASDAIVLARAETGKAG